MDQFLWTGLIFLENFQLNLCFSCQLLRGSFTSMHLTQMKTLYSIMLSIIYFFNGLLLVNLKYISEYFNLYPKPNETNELNQFEVEQELNHIQKLIKNMDNLKGSKDIEKHFRSVRNSIHHLYVRTACGFIYIYTFNVFSLLLCRLKKEKMIINYIRNKSKFLYSPMKIILKNLNN